MIRLSFAAIILVSLAATAALADKSTASSGGKYRPASDHAANDLYNLGVLGARAAFVANPGGGAKGGFEVVELTEDGALAKAGVEIGDLIIGAPRAFGDDPYMELAPKILDAQATKKGGAMQLSLWRDEKTKLVKPVVQGVGAGVKAWPTGSSRDAIVANSLEWLAKSQADDGSFGDEFETPIAVVQTSIAGMAFLAAGHTLNQGAYRMNLKKATEYVVAHAGECDHKPISGVTKSMVHWSLACSAIFLCELQAASPLRGVEDKLLKLRDGILAGVLESGGIGHGPGGRNELGYNEFAAITNVCIIALGALQTSGHEVPKAKLDAMLAYIEKCAGDSGGIGYATDAGYAGNGNCGRTGAAIVAMHATDQTKHPLYKRATRWLQQNLDKVVEGHASPTMHHLTTAMACWAMGKNDWKAYGETYLHEMTMLRCADGSFTARPTEETAKLKYNPDGSQGREYTTASWVIVLCLDCENLCTTFGKKARKGKRTPIGN